MRKYACMYMYTKAVYAFLFFLYYRFASLLLFVKGEKSAFYSLTYQFLLASLFTIEAEYFITAKEILMLLKTQCKICRETNYLFRTCVK